MTEEGGSSPGRFRRAVRAVASDITPLRVSRQFRLLWSGEVITVTGQQVTVVALFIQVFALTGSPAAVGLIGLAEFVPLMLGTAIGGPLVDRYDRRKLLLWTQSLMAATSVILLLTALMDRPPLWPIYGAAGLASFLSGIDVPTRQATTPILVPKELMQSALSLNIVMWNVSVIAGPAIGGVVVGTLGLEWAYGLDVLSYAVAMVLVWRMAPIPPAERAHEQAVWDSLKEGVRYLRGRKVIQSTFAIDIVAMVFGLPEALFPILAVEKFDGGPAETGALFSAIAVGALVASALTGWTHRIKHQGRAVVWMVALWGVAIALFGFAEHLWVAMLFLAVAGGADAISALFRGTILHTSIPDELRGRITSIQFLVVAGGPRLGNLEAGLVAQWTSTTFAVVSGGLACIVGAAAIGMFVPEFWAWHKGDDA